MKNFISTTDWKKQELQDILDYAKDLKINRFNNALKNKSVALLFFNPSMRTRTSFELGVQELGGYAVVLILEKMHGPLNLSSTQLWMKTLKNT